MISGLLCKGATLFKQLWHIVSGCHYCWENYCNMLPPCVTLWIRGKSWCRNTNQNVLFMFPHQSPGEQGKKEPQYLKAFAKSGLFYHCWSDYVTFSVCSGSSVEPLLDCWAELLQRHNIWRQRLITKSHRFLNCVLQSYSVIAPVLGLVNKKPGLNLRNSERFLSNCCLWPVSCLKGIKNYLYRPCSSCHFNRIISFAWNNW